MAYITKEAVAEVRKELKAKFPKFKFSVKKLHNSSVSVTILSSPLKFTDLLDHTNHFTVNHYWIESHFKQPDEQKALLEIYNTLLTAPAKAGRPYYDNSDSQSDYFDTAYYVSIQVGSWDKPYVPM